MVSPFLVVALVGWLEAGLLAVRVWGLLFHGPSRRSFLYMTRGSSRIEAVRLLSWTRPIMRERGLCHGNRLSDACQHTVWIERFLNRSTTRSGQLPTLDKILAELSMLRPGNVESD